MQTRSIITFCSMNFNPCMFYICKTFRDPREGIFMCVTSFQCKVHVPEHDQGGGARGPEGQSQEHILSPRGRLCTSPPKELHWVWSEVCFVSPLKPHPAVTSCCTDHPGVHCYITASGWKVPCGGFDRYRGATFLQVDPHFVCIMNMHGDTGG